MDKLNLFYEMALNNAESVGLYLVIFVSAIGLKLVMSGFKITQYAEKNNQKKEEFIEQIIKARKLKLEEKENLIRELYH